MEGNLAMANTVVNQTEQEANTGYPEGTTKEQWDKYYSDTKSHDKFISDYRFFLNKIVSHLDWMSSENTLWSIDDIKRVMTTELDKIESMDAPNKPGYYRANND